MNKLDFSQKMSIIQTALLVMILAFLLVRGTSGQTREMILAQHLANLLSLSDTVDRDMRDLADNKEAVEGLRVSSKKLTEMIVKTRVELLK